jgi:hypothetical protein
MRHGDTTRAAADGCHERQPTTPRDLGNPPGLHALAYRVGTHVDFRGAMLAALDREAALADLATRADDDATIALIDAWATVLDVLTFYQERIANEGFLRTATEPRSLAELARGSGYEPRPGVAASTHLAFELETAAGAPAETMLPRGLRVQSLPGPGERAQTFETTEPQLARGAWNLLTPRRTMAQVVGRDTPALYLRGSDALVDPGDAILLVGPGRRADSRPDDWELRTVLAVERVPGSAHTLVRLAPALAHPGGGDLGAGPDVFVLRQRAALFGHDAPNPALFSRETTRIAAFLRDDGRWRDATLRPGPIDLDTVYSKVLPGSWLVLRAPSGAALVRADAVSTISRSDFGVSARITRIEPEEHGRAFGDGFPLDLTEVWAQSEPLVLAEAPRSGAIGRGPLRDVALAAGVLDPVEGDRIAVAGTLTGPLAGRQLIASGRRSRMTLRSPGQRRAPGATRDVAAGEVLTLLARPEPVGSRLRWHVRDASGSDGFVDAHADDVVLHGADEDGDEAAEVVTLAAFGPGDGTVLELAAALRGVYDRTTVTILGNVVRAGHGETRQEVLGSGDGSRPGQSFVLAHAPLTHVSSGGAGGAESELEVRVDGVLWERVASFVGRGPHERVYVLSRDAVGATRLQFGDGRYGSRLPSGVENVTARYRVGIGLEGLLRAGQLSVVLSRPLGVKGVRSPLATLGAEDPEGHDQVRRNAALTTRTMDRVVSLHDYADFARAFAGIGKTDAAWLWDGASRRVHLTVAGADGSVVATGSELHAHLADAVAAAGPPGARVVVAPHEPRSFTLSARIGVDHRFEPDAVMIAVRAALGEAFSFDRRAFGQRVDAGEVLATMQRVEGVRFVTRLVLRGPVDEVGRASWDALAGTHRPAALLTIDLDGCALVAEAVRP